MQHVMQGLRSALTHQGPGTSSAALGHLDALEQCVQRLLDEHGGMAEELLRVYEQMGIIFEITRQLPSLHDEIRDLHSYSLDLIGGRGAAAAVQRTRAALAQIRGKDVTGCPAEFDAALRGELEPAALARALAPSGNFTDPYVRAAMRRLGEVSPGELVQLLDGTHYNPAVPIQLAAAMNQASEAKGFLALLRRLVDLLESEPYRRQSLRSLVAPELSPSAFDQITDRAESAERACRVRLASR